MNDNYPVKSASDQLIVSCEKNKWPSWLCHRNKAYRILLDFSSLHSTNQSIKIYIAPLQHRYSEALPSRSEQLRRWWKWEQAPFGRCLRSIGSPFQVVGPTTEKDQVRKLKNLCSTPKSYSCLPYLSFKIWSNWPEGDSERGAAGRNWPMALDSKGTRPAAARHISFTRRRTSANPMDSRPAEILQAEPLKHSQTTGTRILSCI